MRLTPLLPALFLALPLMAQEKPKEPEGISDNSFLIEEAYNQEKGVVQHIFNWQRFQTDRSWVGTFTQEWPVGGQTHQLSYTLPYLHQTGTANGAGDVLLNYRYQALGGDDKELSFSPRLSAILPTGDYKLGRGNGALGAQVMLPLSIPMTDTFFAHLNLGGTVIPKAKNAAGDTADVAGTAVGFSFIWRPHPEFNVMLEAIHTTQDVVLGKDLKEKEKATYLNPGIRWAYNFPSGLQIVPGIAYTYGVGSSKGDNAIFLYLSFEHPFGKK
ncbi:MAG TPA: transporter [Holophagaceae bacterium]|nr:transporter [Holophagaceae bacterium]